jgi:thymidylate synthase (FAD)
MKAELISVMGDDLMVVNAARVSMAKTSEWFEGMNFFHTKFGWMEWIPDLGVAELVEDGRVKQVLKEKDDKLIHYLAKHKHWSPFAHPKIQLRMTMPIFIARQWEKHRIGTTRGYEIYDHNEISRRYVDDEPEFFMPKSWRLRPDESIKQGSGGDAIVPVQHLANNDYKSVIEVAKWAYDRAIRNGIAPEQARMLLPQSMMTQFIETGSLYFYANLCKLRLDSHAQVEIQELAQQVANIIEPLFPCSWKALMETN